MIDLLATGAGKATQFECAANGPGPRSELGNLLRGHAFAMVACEKKPESRRSDVACQHATVGTGQRKATGRALRRNIFKRSLVAAVPRHSHSAGGSFQLKRAHSDAAECPQRDRQAQRGMATRIEIALRVQVERPQTAVRI